MSPTIDQTTSERALAAFAAGMALESLPPSVVDKIKTLILDSIGVSFAGAGAPGVEAVVTALRTWGGVPESGVWARAFRVPAPWAALANGVMATARDFDDTLDDGMLHTQPSVLPACLAIGEAGHATGADFLAAVTVGTEMLCRMGRARRRGQEFLPTGTVACMAAAAASARMLGLHGEATLNACGIAYSQCAGNVQPLREGATVKRLHAGLASKVGVVSAVLAQGGLTGAHRWLEGPFGYFNLYERGDCRPDLLTEALGERFHLLDLSIKPYPCARDNHGAVEAALALTIEHDLQPAHIRAIDVFLPPNAFGVSGSPFASLGGHLVVEAIISAAYCVAAAISQRRLGLNEFTDVAVTNPRIEDLARRVTVHRDPDISDPVTFVPQSVAIHLHDGRTYRRTIRTLRGHPDRPLTDAELWAKFNACCDFCPRPVGGPHAARIADIVMGLEDVPDVGELSRLLALDEGG